MFIVKLIKGLKNVWVSEGDTVKKVEKHSILLYFLREQLPLNNFQKDEVLAFEK